MTAKGLGMPFYKRSFDHGNLFIHFTVKFPETINESQITQIDSALKQMGKLLPSEGEAKEVCNLEAYDDSQKNTHAQGGTEGDSDEDSDEGGHGQKVGC